MWSTTLTTHEVWKVGVCENWIVVDFESNQEKKVQPNIDMNIEYQEIFLKIWCLQILGKKMLLMLGSLLALYNKNLARYK